MCPPLLSTLLRTWYLLLPAYVANAVPVLVGGGAPVDGGRTWRGRRLLGDGKTWRGAAGGVAAGAATAALLDRSPAADGPSHLPAFGVRAALALPVGAVVGDAAGSFLKRRAGVERGGSVPGLDQLGFLLAAVAAARLLAPEWAREALTVPVLAVAGVVTPLLHRGTNVVAHRLGAKAVPW
jgi:CDP-2,3-bis-(O-geranylgeranyl)-sn-glycerol synthase